MLDSHFSLIQGSPPPMRGKVLRKKWRRSRIWDHPRLCGEKFTFLIDTVFPARITPAYAGKSRTFAASYYCIQDHPRLCGEKKNLRVTYYPQEGSPPPMRGKGVPAFFTFFQERITPAYAGKSPSSIWKDFLGGDHPRLCGEKL